ncbi:MAG: KpsF/GutQ family sugar-phosphate isomerase [Chitinophagaceae bacterium]|nr:KpsF/GutQ family sugar-phosphate isomerase [Chitinophagaceae bacterium]
MDTSSIITVALRTIELQAKAINGLFAYVNNDFVKAVEIIAKSNGRLIISGIGKSAVIAKKIVATLNSTGTAAVFMHAADAIHGDLGMIQKEDIVLIISKSGDSPEIKVLAPLIKSFGNTLIGMVGNVQSYLANQSDIVLNTTVEQEACPNNLAPTTSTTAQMVMGDALAVCLMELKGFKSNDFAKFHPGGALGKKLFLRVTDLASQNEKPSVLPTASIKEVIVEMTKKRLGTTVVTDANNTILGIITDGDLRRMLEKTNDFTNLLAKDIMTANPQKIEESALATEALLIMQQKNISQLVAENNGQYAGILHLHDLVREGII